MKKLLVALLMLLPLSGIAGTLYFPYNPALSPDGKTIYFSYDGDIFTVPAEGGLAVRLVSLGGVEGNPKVSPDGRYIAFSSTVQGSNDVYIVPTAGGEVKRLTWHEGSDVPSGWSKDSRYIYFESNRANQRTTYKVAVSGGTPTRLFGHYFNTITNVAENPVTGELYFNESGESISFPTRKRYVGEHNPDIKSWNPAKRSYKQLTDYEGKDTWPMVDKKGNLYYVTDRFNKESNIAKAGAKGEALPLTSFQQSVQYPSISFDGSKMVFILEYKIHCLDLKTGKVEQPAIAIADNNVDIERSFSNLNPSRVAVSPDGKKFAMAMRGMLFISDAKGKYLQQLPTPSNERVDEIVWSADNKTLYYTRTNKGFTTIFTNKADGSSTERYVYGQPCNIKNLTLSNRKDKVAFICGNNSVMVLNTGDNTVEKIADAQFWSYGQYVLSFSADDSYLAFEAMNLFERDIYMYSFKEKRLNNLTNSACSERFPCFSADGKYMYMSANLLGTTFPSGRGTYILYKLPLLNYNTKPFKSDIYDKLFEEKAKEPVEKDGKEKREEKEKKEKKNEKAEGLKVDFNNIHDRLLTVRHDAQAPYIFNKKGKSLLYYRSGMNMYMLEISDPYAEPKPVKGFSGGQFIHSDNDLYAVSNGSVYKVDGASATKVALKGTVVKNLKDEFEQMFYEAWGYMDQNFYDVAFHGTDWKAKRDYYASFLPHVRSRENLKTLINDMLGELNSSHLGFQSSGGEQEQPQTKTHSMETGIVWSNTDPYVVERVVEGSPACNVDTDVKPGDVLVAVNGERVSKSENREKYLSGPVKEIEVKFTFSRQGRETDVKLHTISSSSMKNLLYEEWEKRNRSEVDKRGKGRIAYIHMRDMQVGELTNFYVDMHTKTIGKEAIILDLRYNNGGNVHKEVLDFLSQKAHFNWSYRDFAANPHPNVTPGNMPVIALVNERSLSDAEVTSNGIKELGLATIVGTETYRWIIFTTSGRLLDGSTLRLPAWGCYSLDGKDLEATGVNPDIYVKNTFEDRLKDKDPQLEAAVKEALRQLDK